MKRPSSISLLLLAAVGCDSGGDAAVVAPPAVFAPSAAVTEANAPDFGAIAMRGTFDLPNLAYIGASFLRRPVPVDPNAPEGSPPPVGGTWSAEVSGPGGGSAVYSWEDVRADGEFSSDDVITIDFEDYVDGDLTLNGVMILDDLSALGAITQAGSAWIADATLRLLNVEMLLGSGTFVLNTELPFRMESREVVEIFDITLFEDQFVGALEYKEGSRWLRYLGSDGLSYECEGYAYSPALDGVVRFETDSVVFVNEFGGNLISGFMVATGTDGTFVELDNTATPGIFCQLFGQDCELDIRVEEDGEEGFEAVLTVSVNDLLP